MIAAVGRLFGERASCAPVTGRARSMRPHRDTSVPHREFFRAVVIGETVALACTCPRGEDHWFEPGEENPGDPRIGARLRAKLALADDGANSSDRLG
ncbi:hypothetical protein LQ757_04485 [Agromyces sp. SYSU K20354]|uniref:hypothetical protein n=1 Tax=Agromyces cavernae TaxID=2898659 RepID=UPI001E34756D|nr:hypothetical protein [Agromyces cavernae]MCD2441531.1 hypothetical protein [Agromyces cavernae]